MPLKCSSLLSVVEILDDRIRKNTQDGLEVNIQNCNKYVQVTQLADDTTVFLRNEQAIKTA